MRLHAGGAIVRATLRAIVARDGTTCRRCGHPVDIGLSGLDPDGPTIGHVIPVRSGGTDELGNLALEHRRCNLAAGPRPTPPRALLAAPVQEKGEAGS